MREAPAPERKVKNGMAKKNEEENWCSPQASGNGWNGQVYGLWTQLYICNFDSAIFDIFLRVKLFPKHPRLAMNAAHGFTTLVLTCSIHEMKSEKKVGWLVLAFILANTIKEIQRVSTSKCWSVVVLGQLLLAGMIFVPIWINLCQLVSWEHAQISYMLIGFQWLNMKQALLFEFGWSHCLPRFGQLSGLSSE